MLSVDLTRYASERQLTRSQPTRDANIERMTAKEELLAQAPQWTDAQAVAALRVVAAHDELASYLDDEAKRSAEELDAREDHWAEAGARDAIREEPW